MAHATAGTDLFGRGQTDVSDGLGTGCTGPSDDGHAVVMAAIQAFRLADSQLGGAVLYSTVVAYLRSHLGPLLVDGMGESGPSAIFNATASMLEMAGWMAHDRGDDNTAESHFSRALTFTRIGEDQYLRAHILGSMSHLAAHMRRAPDAVRLARQGLQLTRGAPPHTSLRARLLALEARGAAGLGERHTARALLTRADSELPEGEPAAPPLSPWVSHYDRASLASDISRCLRRLGDLAATRRQAEFIIAARSAERFRSRGLALLMLADVLVAQGTIDEASTVLTQALDSNLPLGSAPIIRRLITLHQALAPYRNDTRVADAYAMVEVALQPADTSLKDSRARSAGRRA